MTFRYSYKTVMRETEGIAQGQGPRDQLMTNDNDIKTSSDIKQPRFRNCKAKVWITRFTRAKSTTERRH